MKNDPLTAAAGLFIFVFFGVFLGGGWLIWQTLDRAGIAALAYESWADFLKSFFLFIKDGGRVLDLTWQAALRLALPLGLAGWAAWAAARGEYRAVQSPGRHLRGRRYLKDREAARAFAASASAECRAVGEGIRLHSGLPPISIARELMRFLIVGSSGSGKTTLITPMLMACVERGDRCFVLDIKGDFSRVLPAPIVLLAPWDARSKVWEIASDVDDKASARAFAAAIVPEATSGSGAMWVNAARQVLVGCLLKLIRVNKGRWGFRDLADLCFGQSVEQLQELMKTYFPEGVNAVAGAGVTTAGILVNLTSMLPLVTDLAEAWPHPPAPGQGFSMRKWLARDNNVAAHDNIVVLPGNGHFGQLFAELARSLLQVASQAISDPSQLGESRDRQVWFFLDELPQIGKVEALGLMIETGRSKGIRLVAGLQDIAQLKHIYGPDRARGWVSQFQNIVITQTQAGETAKYISAEVIGQREIEKTTVSNSSGGQSTTTVSIESSPVLLPAELSSELGPTRGGVDILWLGFGDALRLRIPFSNYPEIREAVELAAWAAGGDTYIYESAEPATTAPQAGGQASALETESPIASAVLGSAVDAVIPGADLVSHIIEAIEQVAPAPAAVSAAPPARRRKLRRKKEFFHTEDEQE